MKNKKGHNILLIAILLLTAISLWIFVTLHEILQGKKGQVKPPPSEVKILIPKLDLKVIEDLKKRSK